MVSILRSTHPYAIISLLCIHKLPSANSVCNCVVKRYSSMVKTTLMA